MIQTEELLRKKREYNKNYRLVQKYQDYHNIYYNTVIKPIYEQNNNKCIVCGCSLAGRQLLAKYCTECKKVKRKEWRKAEYHRNIERIKSYNQNNKEKIQAVNRKISQRHRDNLSDRYIIKLLVERWGFSRSYIKANPEIIEIKRKVLSIERLIS